MANSNAASVRIRGATRQNTNGQKRHDERKGDQPGYVDASLSHENSELISSVGGSEAWARCVELREQTNAERRLRKNASVTQNGVLTFGTDAQPAIEALSSADQDALFLKAARACADVMQCDLTGLTVHRDESAIHAHFQTLGRRHDGTPLPRVGGGLGAELQDAVAACVAHLGIERGQPMAKDATVSERKIHRSVKQLHEDLPKEIAAAERKLEKNLALVEKNQSKIEAGKGDIEKIEKRLSQYKKRCVDAEAKISELEKLRADVKLPRPLQVELAVGLMKKKTARVYTVKTAKEWLRDARAKDEIAKRDYEEFVRRDKEKLKKQLARVTSFDTNSRKILYKDGAAQVEQTDDRANYMIRHKSGGYVHFRTGSIAMFSNANDAQDALRAQVSFIREQMPVVSAAKIELEQSPTKERTLKPRSPSSGMSRR